MFYLRCIVLILCLAKGDGMLKVQGYARDVSEHCKRRDSLPSVFLSMHVMDASAQVLHFTRLDQPYSCFASIRAETNHNIVMLIQLPPDENEARYCGNGYQIAVFEFTETFGGYWGPVPEAVVERAPDMSVYTKQYTLARPTTTTTTEQTNNKHKQTTELPTAEGPTAEGPAVTQSFIIEMPLVNISGDLVPGESKDKKPFDVDEFFDLFYDVVPRPGMSYETSILPLVQIAVKKQEGRREGDRDEEPRYEIDYDAGQFTPDHRLTVPAWPKKTNTNRNRNRWKKKKLQDKRVEPKQNSQQRTTEPTNTRKLKQFTLPTTNHRSSYSHVPPQAITEITETYKGFNVIDDILKTLNESGDLIKQEPSTDSSFLAMLNISEKTNHNLSVYLAPYPMDTFLHVSDVPVRFTKNQSEFPIGGSSESILSVSSQDAQLEYTTNKSELEYSTLGLQHLDVSLDDVFKTKDIIESKKIEKTPFTVPSTFDEDTTSTRTIMEGSSKPFIHTSGIDERHHNGTDQITNDAAAPVTTTHTGSLSGTLVDHESWENVVQSAPEMAGLLNVHGAELGNISYFNTSVEATPPNKRRKRSIAAIGVEEAQPRRRATSRAPPSAASVFSPVDVREFARLLELPDDEMSNRVTIKFDTNGSTQMFDLCKTYDGKKSRHLLLFNSSRIILSIGNFSMSHVMVVLTTGRPLAPDEPQCPTQLVECQVLGTRLCIDSTNACDGIPNCGSSNAYDEDRVLCGLIGQDRSVMLAAATFLAMLATTIYIVHYWLKKCVPNVAEAFFLYSDSADNELYLDTIMRSPLEVGKEDNYVYNSSFFEEDINMEFSSTGRKSVNVFRRVLSILPKLNLFRHRQASEGLDDQSGGQAIRKKFSFPELEIRKMIVGKKVDQQVQTGESIEMAYLKKINAFNRIDVSERYPSTSSTKRQIFTHAIPLQSLPSAKRTISIDAGSDSPGPSVENVAPIYRRSIVPGVVEEKEINSTLYDAGRSNILKSNTSNTTHVDQGRKCLRFDDEAVYIPREADSEENTPHMTRIHVSPGRPSKRLHQKSDGQESERGGADFRKFFKMKKDRK